MDPSFQSVALTRESADKELTTLLNRALKNVPFVKLDAIDEVLSLFQNAVEFMEHNLELDDDDDSHTSESDDSKRHLDVHHQHQREIQQARLMSLAGANIATTSSSSSSPSNGAASDSESSEFLPKQITNKQILGVAVTVDYSSPGAQRRSLNPKRASGPLVGLGLKPAAAAPQTTNVKPFGLHGTTHKPSSRATAASNAFSSNAPSPPPSFPSQSSSAHNSPIFTSNNTLSHDPLNELPAVQSEPADVAAGVAAGNITQQQLKHKLVVKVAGGGGGREYPSPKLGPRSLNSTPTTAGRPAINANVTLPAAETLNGRIDAGGAQVPARSAEVEADDEADDEAEADADAGDLIRVPDPKKDRLKQIKDELPATASPKQFRSSLHLLDLAQKHSIETDPAEINNFVSAPLSSAMSASAVLSAVPQSLGGGSSSNTPKPAYLRRLDSPETHHGQLMAAKAKLQLIINRGLLCTDKIKLEKFAQIRATLEKALQKMESSLVPTSTQG